ncbi:MAG TPA: c-type cytochrome domain-containing protein, partial [Gemmataceae bacterium]|nr:c-type cytochrome domain-containing protein [Gemmataceae bacterium]
MLRTLPVLALLSVPTSALAQPLPAKIDFNRDVRPILSNNCFQCHGPDEKERKAELRLDIRPAETIGRPGASPLLDRVASNEPSEVMPPPKTGKTLTARERDILKQWVQEGANYATHWSYVKPTRPALPTGHTQPVPGPRNGRGVWPEQTGHAVDAFILDRLAREKLTPSP